MLTRRAYVHQHAVKPGESCLASPMHAICLPQAALASKSSPKIFLSKHCLFLTPLHSNGKGVRLHQTELRFKICYTEI